MKQIFRMALSALQLKDQAFQSASAGGPAGLRQSALLVAVVSLVAGLGLLVGGVTDAVRGFQPGQLEASFDELLSTLEQSQVSPEVLAQIGDSLEAGLNIGLRVAALPTPLPRPVIGVAAGLGLWLGQPFSLAGSWLAYTLMALVAARLLGGKARLPDMLAATALANVPYVLGLLAFIPYCGALLSLAAWVWSSLIFVKATAIANELPTDKAILAWAAPAVVLAIFWSLVLAGGLAAFVILILSAAGG